MKISYSAAPTPAQREAAADLIDAGGQLAEKLDRAKLARACVIVIALDAAGRVIGVGAVKERRGSIAEVGYLMVDPEFRRRGIAQELTQRRIAAARDAGLELLFTNVRRDNVESRGNLHKAGFVLWGDFMSAYHTQRVISWFYYPLTAEARVEAHLKRLTRKLPKAPTGGSPPRR